MFFGLPRVSLVANVNGKTTPGVKVATAVLINGELWGFFAPSNVAVEDVKAATARVQPHYAVPTKYVSLDNFPETA